MSKTKTLLSIIAVLVIIIVSSVLINLYVLGGAILTPKIFLNGDTVILSQQAKDKLDMIYTSNLKYEIPVCLSGEIINDRIRVIDIEQADIVESNTNNVTYKRCATYIGSDKVIGNLHNHPNGVCMLSDKDITTYVGNMPNGHEVIGLKCKQGYVFYVLSFMESEVENG